MKWQAVHPDEHCPVPQVLPLCPNSGYIQGGHDSGAACKCRPCYCEKDGSPSPIILIHHELIDGLPVRSFEEGSHECHLGE
jgi:hypothetical protein